MPIARSATCRCASSCSAATSGCNPTGASATPPHAEDPPAARAVAVAYSGGRDSTALLHATLAAAAPLGIAVAALHVHHGLSPQADDFASHCESACRRWTTAGRPAAFEMRRLDGQPARGESVEAWARRGRYGALREMALARGIGLVLLAHHRRDQAETFLLQALRGAGVDGLSAMPRRVEREGVVWARPWLTLPREAVEAYARHHRLRWVDDASNADPRFSRNRLRAQVWPALLDAFPQAEASLADAATRAQDGWAGLADWAAVDLAAASAGDAIDVDRWRELAPARRSNVLRAWLRERSGRVPPATLIERLSSELGAGPSSRWPAPPGELRCHRGVLRYELVPTVREAIDTPAFLLAVDLGRIGKHRVEPWRGTLVVRRVAAGGVPTSLARTLELRPRRAGDRFQAGIGRPPRSLKLQFQDAGVPAWLRDGPIVAGTESIVYVPGLGLDARAVSVPGTPRVSIEWRADPPGVVEDRSEDVEPRR